jgi:hypothetical protein
MLGGRRPTHHTPFTQLLPAIIVIYPTYCSTFLSKAPHRHGSSLSLISVACHGFSPPSLYCMPWMRAASCSAPGRRPPLPRGWCRRHSPPWPRAEAGVAGPPAMDGESSSAPGREHKRDRVRGVRLAATRSSQRQGWRTPGVGGSPSATV